MDGAATSIAFSISIGASLVPVFIGTLVAMRSAQAATARRDTTVSIMFGIAWLLIVLNVVAATVVAVRGMAYVGLVEGALLLTAAFTVTGVVLGLMRGMRSGRAIKTQNA
jgi:hypothetical protein